MISDRFVLLKKQESAFMRFVVSILLLVLFSPTLRAQGSDEQKAMQLIQKGKEEQRKNRPEKAEKYFLKSVALAPAYPAAYSTLGYHYLEQKLYDRAAGTFEQATKSCRECAASFGLQMAEAFCKAGQYERAETILDEWKPASVITKEQQGKLTLLKANVQFGKYAATHICLDTPVNMGPAINTKYDEYFPSVLPDDSVLVFTRRTNGIDEDFYKAHRDSCGGWFLARDMGSPPNSIQQEGAQFLSADGHYLFFMRCGNRSENGWEAGGCDLYFSYTEAEGWSQPVSFGATINTPGYEGMPSLSSDNRELFFVSRKEGGQGGMDIWVTRFENGLWQIPENLGPEVNTPFDESAPFIAPDNNTLFFTSNGHPGVGGNDIFRTERNASGIWQRPVNLGLPINSPGEDVSFCISADGSKAYFASDRAGGAGGMDLYEVKIPDELQPQPVTFIVGKTYDSLTRQPITYAQVELYDTVTGDKLYQFVTNRGDGSYMGAVGLNRGYALRAYRVGYGEYTDTVSFSLSNTAHPDTLNFALLPTYYVRDLEEQKQQERQALLWIDSTLLTIHFRKNEVSLNDSLKQLLKEKLQSVPEQNIVYYINGYTDNSGAAYINEEVSFARARALAGCLQEYGVAPELMHIQGWADANPIAPNDTEENKFINRRVELVLRWELIRKPVD